MDKTFNAAEAEARLYKAWDKAGAFKAGANASSTETFCIMIPPPNVTGSLHMGHAFNNTLQDILVRWHRMRGHDTLWQPGQDHAGIATQMVVERELAKDGKRRTDFSREDFVDLVWEQKKKSGGTIIEQLKRLGASCDWSRNAFTMAGAPGDTRVGHENSPDFHDAVIKTFVEFYDKGIIYRGKRLVNWDPHFETAISDLEVENIETPGHMWHFKYPLADGQTYEYVEKDEDGNVTLSETRDYISIATTRPETMLGDGAVAVHPSDERYAPIVGKLCEIPVGPKEHRRLIPIITDEYPDPDFGSGAVKITGAHDFNDYAVASRGGIPMYRLMDTKGALRADGNPYAEEAALALSVARGEKTLNVQEADAVNLVPDDLRGLDRFEARKRVVEQITSEGLAVMVANPKWAEADEEARAEMSETIPLVENKPIMQPFGDRSKVVIEPMLTDQWFVDAAQIVGPALEGVRDGTTEILPEQHKKVYFQWLENIEPWTISRQLWWGHQIPVWYGPRVSTSELKGGGYATRIYNDEPVSFCAPTFEEAREQALAYYKENGRDIALNFEEVADKASAIEFQIENEDMAVALYRDPDVLDTWFSSGLWPLGTLGWPEDTPELQKYFPTNVLITGFDIIFFWVARMMMMQYAMVGERPFDTVYVHALVRDEKGKKMSKSLGNVLDPLELIDEYGADAVRFTLASMAAMGRDLKLSTQRIAGYRNFGTKLWNAARFAEMNGVFEVARNATPPSPSATANRWIIGEVAKTREAVDQALSDFRFNDASNAMYSFVWGTFCDWYLELSKPLFFSEDDEIIAETRDVMGWALDQCLIMLHPFMPFITEEIWSLSAQNRAKPLVHGDWPTYMTAQLVDQTADTEMNWVIRLIEQIRSVRAETGVPAGAKVTLIDLGLDDVAQKSLSNNRALIERMARIETFGSADSAPKGAVTIPVQGGTFCLPLAGVIDIAAESARLSKALEKNAKELGGLTGRLNNAKFVANAPEEVVAEAKARMAELEDEAAKLQAAQARLAELA
ncbi:MAG: valine--tRNA ligase [Pseudomonadota bacterium]